MGKMTTEEAKMILEEVKVIDDSMYQYNPKYLEALDLAITTLEEIDRAIENWCSISRLALALKMSLKDERHKLDKIASEIEEQVKLVESMGCSAKQFRVAWGIVNQYRGEQNEM